jgi:hypothetical protein
MNEGIMQQIRESEVVTLNGKFSKKDLEQLSYKIKESAEIDYKRKKEWLKEREINRKALNKKSKELEKEIPFELAWHCFLAPYQTYVNSEFLETYKEWL